MFLTELMSKKKIAWLYLLYRKQVEKQAGYGAHHSPEKQPTVSMQYYGGWLLTWR